MRELLRKGLLRAAASLEAQPAQPPRHDPMTGAAAKRPPQSDVQPTAGQMLGEMAEKAWNTLCLIIILLFIYVIFW